jgi:nitronate monooxygenase
VSNAGVLDLMGGGRGDRGWMQRELAIVIAQVSKPWGIDFLTWAIDIGTIADIRDSRVRVRHAEGVDLS